MKAMFIKRRGRKSSGLAIPVLVILAILAAACSPYTLLSGGPNFPTTASTATPRPTQNPANAQPQAPASPTPAPAMPTMTMPMPTQAPQATEPSSSIPATGAQQVSISNFAFSPASLTVQAGERVTWTNKDQTAHTVTADNGLFDSGPLNPGDTFSFTFRQAGTVSYHCSFHPNMVASVTVSAGSSGAAAQPSPTLSQPAPTAAPQTGGPSAPGVQRVSIANMAFSPATLTVPLGTKVRWTNNDTLAHTVTAKSGTFNSGPLNPGATFAVSFSRPGTYVYYCQIHPNMVATIIVTGPAGSDNGSGTNSGGMNNPPGGNPYGGNSGGGSSGGNPYGGNSGGGSSGGYGGYHY